MTDRFVVRRSGSVVPALTRRVTGSALSLLLIGGLLAMPTPAAVAETELSDDPDPGVECPDEVEQNPEAAAAADEALATALADACGVPVEVTSARGFGERTWAQPEGHLHSEVYTVPQWARDETGSWVDVDTSLVWAEDGSVRSAATVSEVRVSGGGDGPFVTATDPNGNALSLTWPDALPVPMLDGNTATYADVLPDVDLAVTAGVDGFSYALVVHTPEAAANPALSRVEVGITSIGLNVSQTADELVEATDAAGEPVFVTGSALMWDASVPDADPEDESELPGGLEQDGASPGRVEAMSVELDGGRLAVIPDAEMLADPSVVFPVVIDPFFVGGRLHWANVHQQQPSRGWTNDSAWPRAGGMRVGRCTWSGCASATGLWRSVVRFNTDQLRGRHIISSAVKMTQTHTGGCGSYPLHLWQVNAFTSGVSWNGVNWLHGGPLQSKTVASSNSTGCSTSYPNRAVTFNGSAVKARVQHHANQRYKSISFGLRSGNESDRNQWRRISRNSLRLEVEHASYPQTPTNMSTHGKGCSTSSPGPWLTTGKPKLTGTPRNADGTGHYKLYVYRGTTNVYSHRSGKITVNNAISHTPTITLTDGAHRWRMRTESASAGVPPSLYHAWCYFRVDTKPPPMPSAQQLTDNPQQGDPVQFRLTGSSDTNRFRYNLSGGSSTTVTASGGAATITVNPPTTTIDHQLQVWALDAAGNVSARYDLWFTAAKDLQVPVAGAWRFDGDRRDDSGHGHDLALGTDVPLATDRQGRADGAVRLDGQSCVSTTEPALHTDQSFTVAAWARPNNAPRMTIMSQAGTANTAFRLRKDDNHRWLFTIFSEDSSSPVWQSTSSPPGAVGQWQHVAGVYDAAAAKARLYVNGVLQDVRDISAAWDAPGRLFVGCSSTGGYPGWDRFNGDLDDVVAYQGVLTDGQIEQLMTGGPPAGQVSSWPLRGNGADAGPGGHDLTVPDSATWVPDSFGRGGSAMQLDGQSCAATDGPVVRTDDSFTVAAWARPGDNGDTRMRLLSQAGTNTTAFRLSRMDNNQWVFSVPAQDDSSPTWHSAFAPPDATTGGWQHLVGVYDAAAGKVRIYVDGELQGEATAPDVLWRGGGALHVGCAANAGGTWEHWVGAVHDVQVWRGAATPEQVQAVAVERVSFWGLDAHGQDPWGGNDLTFHGEFEWVDDRFGFPESAFGLGLDGTGWAETAGTVLTTDESFTVSAWVRLDDKSSYQTMVAQAGNEMVSFSLSYHPWADRWQFAMPSQDSAASPSWLFARSDQSPVLGQWYHLAGVFDLGANEMSLYVNGELQDTVAGPAEPWHVAGELLVGASGDTSGARWDHTVGAIDMVRVYSGVLDERRIADQGVVPVPFTTGADQGPV